MTSYVDTYVACSDKGSLEAFLRDFDNVIPIQQGRAAQKIVLDDGATVTIDAAGDVSLFYACVRTEKEISLPEGIVSAEPSVGASVVGVWA